MKKLITIVLTASFINANSQVCFSPASTFTTSAIPKSIITADFNKDGKLDLAVTTFANGVSILLGNGIGGFGAPTNFSLSCCPQSVISNDFNGDGNLDLVIAKSGTSSADEVSILLGTGTGSFGTATNYSVGYTPVSLVSEDFNTDGNADLAVANYNTVSNNVSILLGIGTGIFGTATNFAVDSGAVSITSADFNGDAKFDLAVANAISKNVTVLLGTGTGSFSSPTKFNSGIPPWSILNSDFNGDGKLDLATANWGTSNVSVILGTGTGSFVTAVNFPVGTSPNSLACGDFNGDGKIDLATANGNSSNISVLLNCTTVLSVFDFNNRKEEFVYPNPNNGSFKIQIDSEVKNGEMFLLNSIGQKAHEQKIIQGENNIVTHNLAKGLYHYIILKDKELIGNGKFAIE